MCKGISKHSSTFMQLLFMFIKTLKKTARCKIMKLKIMVWWGKKDFFLWRKWVSINTHSSKTQENFVRHTSAFVVDVEWTISTITARSPYARRSFNIELVFCSDIILWHEDAFMWPTIIFNAETDAGQSRYFFVNPVLQVSLFGTELLMPYPFIAAASVILHCLLK